MMDHWNVSILGDGTAPGGLRYFYYDGWNLIEDGTSPWNPEHFYVNGARIDEIVASYTWGEPSYHHYDANGNCMTLTNAAGNITEQYYYDAFGKPYMFDAVGNWLSASPSGNRFLFTGREYISELKLYDYRNRLYNPQMGRFMQPDPKEFAAGDYNLYRYCHNDPVNRSDPSGLVDLSFTPGTAAFAPNLHWEKTYNPNNTFTVAGHADSHGIMNASGAYVPMKLIVDVIVKNNTQNKPIELVACDTAQGNNPFAKLLAEAVAARTGLTTKVLAPTTEVAPGKPYGPPQILPELKPGGERLPLGSHDRYDWSKPGRQKEFTAKPNKKHPGD